MEWPELHNDFREFLHLLNRNNAEYLLIGGYAVGYHGYPRATNNFDIWVNPSPENRKRVAAALREFGFDVPDLSEWEQNPVKILRLGREPVRFDIFTSVIGLDFDSAYEARQRAMQGDLQIDIISIEHLRKTKESAARPKDQEDLRNLPEPS